ncbi:hypothetical protein [Klebsiella pneumoniae]|nr:hypothetical protein [Acinetobacter baumannii]MEE1856681.1 hypothetical protein [Acinetobacter baumannii]HAV6151243.1 hypothetical protein [Acinetobacter baumannii]HAV6215208.1 hypothetical protein [Acinetobacter baumannii]
MAVKVMLTLDDQLHASIERMAEIQGLPKATVARGLLEGQKPVIDAMIKAHDDLIMGKDKKDVEREYLEFMGRLVIDEITKD